MGTKQKYKPKSTYQMVQEVKHSENPKEYPKEKYSPGDALRLKHSENDSPTLVCVENFISEENFWLVRVNWWNVRDWRFEEEDFQEDMLEPQKK